MVPGILASSGPWSRRTAPRQELLWVAVQEVLGEPRFPLKGSVNGDIDIDMESYHNMDI